MHLPTRFVVALLVVPVCVGASSAQQTAPAGLPSANRITLDVVVAPKSGPPVANLEKQDFTIVDNGAPRTIATFDALSGPQTPVEVVLLIDAVNTRLQDIGHEGKQLDAFLKANDGHLARPTALALLTDSGVQLQRGFSTDGNMLSSALDVDLANLNQVRRNNLWAAAELLQLSLNALTDLATKTATLPGHKVILWVSPGWPLLSGPMVDFGAKQTQQFFHEIVGISTLLRRGDITLYSIDPVGTGEDISTVNNYQGFLKGIAKPGDVQIPDLSLQVIATQSGGLVLGHSNDTSSLLERCVSDTSAFYRLSFDAPPADHSDEYHALQVKVSGPGLTARTRTGYYDQP
jgi:VWFA-related protein